ncbi:Y-box-binding protein 2-A-like [Portunus trituberculatus]|uniref:Y-box-binding protein 2-A-like n=1 Tax=Portunus trituberculatus TaxID=210409 RepID=UPI001E1CBBE9|nr:Y-box-binding protein 2-A-like [Portunus trituberculatus]
MVKVTMLIHGSLPLPLPARILTDTDLATITETISKAVSDKKQCCIVLRDVSKAFDKMASQQHHGQIKWYNFKRSYVFISDYNTKTDVFVHFFCLKRSLQKRLLREGDKVHFTVYKEDKGLEARDVARTGNNTKACASSPKPPLRTWGYGS